jgi:hypothetical protein
VINILYLFKEEKNGLKVTLFHLGLGVLAAFSNYFLVLWFYSFFIYQFLNILLYPSPYKSLNIAELIIYGSSLELIARMANTSPLIPYELGKYFILGLCVLGLILGNKESKASWIGPLIILLLIPSLFFDLSGRVTFKDIRFNIFGMLNVGAVIWFFSTLRIKQETFLSWLRLLVFPAISVLAFAYFKTPDYSDIKFSLGANFDTTGGFGSNQVSTVLGFGAFLTLVSLMLDRKITNSKIGDFVLLAGFTVQGLLTFSRGGMLVAALAFIIFLFYVSKLKPQEKKFYRIPNLGKYFLPMITAVVALAFFANLLTGGLLFLRYQGETVGTLSGSKEVDLNHFTTNRLNIMLSDLDLWLDHPLLGVGAAASPHLRVHERGEAPHVEFSRILAEHGIFGMIILVILGIFLIGRLKNAPDNLIKAIVYSLFVIAILTSFHAAMRTFITPLLLGIISIPIYQSFTIKEVSNQQSEIEAEAII